MIQVGLWAEYARRRLTRLLRRSCSRPFRRCKLSSTWPNAFSKLTLSPAHAGQEITSISEAENFLNRLDTSKQNLPRWQKVRQGLLIARHSMGAYDLAWREFREALQIEGWLAQ
jgi:hypothetical protein